MKSGKLRLAALVTAFQCGFLAQASSAAEFVIASSGHAKAVISLPANPSVSLSYAAKELSSYLERMTGATFAIRTDEKKAPVIRLGEPYSGGKPEEIRIYLKDPKTLVVTGEGPRGPLYAVYELLERLGCGFWSPINETIPKRPDLAVPGDISVTDAPAFEVRDPHGESAIYSSAWKVKIRVNGDMYAGSLAPEHGGHRQYDIGQIAAGMPDAKMMASHPEWFAYRRAGKSRSSQQICMTNPGCRTEVLRRARAMMSADPARRQISVSVADGGDFCECDDCMKLRQHEGGMSGPEISLANYVAKELAKDFPKVRILTFAYESTMKPPKTLKLEPNVDVCFAYIQRDFSRPPSETPGHDRLLGEWSKLSGRNVYVWGYNAPFKDYLVPWPILDTMGPEIRTYHKFGVKGVYMQMAEGSTADFIDLRCWLCAKLLWNPEQDEWHLIEAWCKGACGKGGPKVLAWLKEQQRLRTSSTGFGVYMNDPRFFMKPQDLFTGDRLLSEAEAAAAGDDRALDQIRRIRYPVRHAMLLLYNHEVAAAAKNCGYPIPSREKLFGELVETTKACRNNCWNEGGGWFANFMPYIRHGETLAEVRAVNTGPRGEWTFWNPVVTESEEDPHVVYDTTAGLYYRLIASGPEIRVRSAKAAIKLFDDGCQESVVWTAKKGDESLVGVRGAELVRAKDGAWRIYASSVEEGLALEGERPDDAARNRLFVLKGGKDPLGKFSMKARLLTDLDAADPTVVRDQGGTCYLAFVTEQKPYTLRLVQMNSPDSVSGKSSVLLSTENESERPGSPAFARMGEDLYLLYSIGGRHSAISQIRALRFKKGSILSAKNWEKCEKPVIVSGNCFGTESAVLVGPRSPSTFMSSDGTENWVIFRGWTKRVPADEKRDSIVCMQRLDDGTDKNRMLFGTAAEFSGSRMRVLQPSGDRGRVPARRVKK